MEKGFRDLGLALIPEVPGSLKEDGGTVRPGGLGPSFRREDEGESRRKKETNPGGPDPTRERPSHWHTTGKRVNAEPPT
jgi:hypothetical protein